MQEKLSGKFQLMLFKALPLTMLVSGSLLLLIYHFFFREYGMPVEAGLIAEMVTVPLGFPDLEIYKYVLETENYLIFQKFESLPPLIVPQFTLGFGVIVVFLLCLGLVLVS